jgi:uncharacterized membrane protein
VELLVRLLLFVHVAAGVTALISATATLFTRMGAQAHRTIGMTYVWSMFVITVTAIPVTFLRPSVFLFVISVFSGYMALIGYRRGRRNDTVNHIDRTAARIMLATAVLMIGYGLLMVISAAPLGWALAAFGALGVQFGREDLRDTTQPLPQRTKVARHLQRMLGGTIATITAVLVTQVAPRVSNDGFAETLIWLAPTLLLTPLIAVWSARVLRGDGYQLFGRRRTNVANGTESER